MIVAVLLTACADDWEETPAINTDSIIGLDVDMSQDWRQEKTGTRAAMAQKVVPLTAHGAATGLTLTATTVNGINRHANAETVTRGVAKETVNESFAILAYDYENANVWGTDAVSIAYTDLASLSNSVWTIGSPRKWPGNGHSLRYVGYLPATSGSISSVATIGAKGVPSLKWSTNTTVANQEDLMTAVSPVSNYGTNNGRIKMPFRHALTCVKFALGNGFPAGAVIDKIEVMGVAREGTLWIEENALRWDVDATTRTTFTMSNIGFATTSATANAIIAPAATDGEHQTTLLVIPQTFNDATNQKVCLTYHVGSNNPVTLTATLDGQTWLPGTTVTYVVSNATNPMNAVLTVSAGSTTWLGGQAVFDVTSYAAKASDGTYDHDLSWSVVGYSDDEGVTFHTEKPASCNWLSIVTTSGTGGAEAQMGIATIAKQTAKATQELSMTSTDENYATKILTDALKTNGTFGSANDYYDLSKHDFNGNSTLRNTANCYVVNRPGWYKLPLVYGNAIKNGQANTQAWTGTPKIAYSGSVASPYIQENGTPNNAVLCWQDADGLVTVESDLEYNSTEGVYYLKFRVDASTIKPGNAMIAVRTTNTIMWSWHIWVTPAEICATKECYASRHNRRFHFMPIPLGWVPLNGTQQQYQSRSVLVKIAQEGGKTAVFRLTQLPGADTDGATYGYAPYYQFGRKDPMLPCNGSTSGDHTQYPTGGSLLWRIVTTANATYTYAQGIQNPNVFYATTNYADWCKTTYYNLWNTGSYTGYTNSQVVKTIYDPCPVGFKMPESGFAAFFTTEDNTVNATLTTMSKLNKSGNFNRGWTFYTTPAKTETIYIPSLTCREHTSGLMRSEAGGRVAEHGWYWSAMGGSPSISVSGSNQNYANRGTSFGSHSTGAAPHCQHCRAWGFTIMPVKE